MADSALLRLMATAGGYNSQIPAKGNKKQGL
jgi:hypothetical protein